ncbi:MAG: N-acetylmuramic acid 6-phosphate etherase [Chloroflexi bacterium]|nr:N-acetylmuramic acid 6-phosphate etherase [Chloroflexota bacterium]
MTHSSPVPITEAVNPRTVNIDSLSTQEIVALINREDARVAPAIEKVLPQIAQAVDMIVGRLRQGGRLLYFGAGTSGRLGVLDASEIPPTFNTHPELVQGFIAGGDVALRNSVEYAEDDEEDGRRLVQEVGVGEKDVVVGISASGNTPWLLAVLEEAKARAAATIGITSNPHAALIPLVDIAIVPVVGPEVIAGSSRMKAGTAQKMILNMLSTAAMIRLGKVYRNLMVDVAPINDKLRQRALHILQDVTGVDADKAWAALEASDFQVKTALVMVLTGVSAAEANRLLEQGGGFVQKALDLAQQEALP